jgi:predicted DNA-binding transcriptional regulator AlpA
MHPHEYALLSRQKQTRPFEFETEAEAPQAATQESRWARAPPFELLTEAEAAKRLRISQRHLQRLVEIGEGPPRTRLGDRRVAYPLDGLTAWVRQRTSTAEAT